MHIAAKSTNPDGTMRVTVTLPPNPPMTALLRSTIDATLRKTLLAPSPGAALQVDVIAPGVGTDIAPGGISAELYPL
jgi:hypothetical protein